MKVTVFKKSGCPWAAAVEAFLKQLDVPFDIKDMTRHPQYLREIEQKTGQSSSPTVELDGELLPDASVEDVARALEQAGIAT
ncbi:MAG TPA: glutaredoxin family protein [Patescibacteria group bacterium]|nr:glutaredoxin family protein [Patescibacteria group bacterium]